MPDRELATAADYADALLTTRRAKNVMVLVLLLMLLGQLALFFVVRYGHAVAPQLSATTQPLGEHSTQLMEYLTSGCLFLGVTVSIILGLALLLIVNIMLVGRLIGVGRLTSAYLWCLALLVLLFPWQAFLNDVRLTSDQASFKVPGVLYTWDELSAPESGAHFSTEDPAKAALKWARYVGMPGLALIVLLVIQAKSNRGLRQALGEDSLLITDETINA